MSTKLQTSLKGWALFTQDGQYAVFTPSPPASSLMARGMSTAESPREIGKNTDSWLNVVPNSSKGAVLTNGKSSAGQTLSDLSVVDAKTGEGQAISPSVTGVRSFGNDIVYRIGEGDQAGIYVQTLQ